VSARGQSTVDLTLDTYSHLLPAMHQQAATAMDAILAGSLDGSKSHAE
jgi:hypothetical protein